jgi:hypothetical protein
MSLPRTAKPRSERPDTKTLLRLGREDLSDSPPAKAGAAARALPTAETAPDSQPAGARRPVQLWFKGVAEPVRAHAEFGDASLQLKADLPFLELDSIVGVSAVDGEAPLHGRIRRVAFEPSLERRVPQLCVDVSLSDSIPPSLGPAVKPAAAQARPPGGVSTAGAHAPTATLPSRILGWIAALAVGAACGAGVAFLWLTPRFAILEQQRADRSGAQTARSSAAAGAPYAPAFDLTQHVAVAAADVPLFADAPLAYPELDPVAADESGAGVNAQGVLVTEDPARTAAAGDTRGAPDSRERHPGGASLPEVSVEGARTRVFVPMRGDGQGLQQYELTTPGIAVSVPHARASIPLGSYGIQRGIVRRVWLREDAGGVQVRVITRRPTARAVATYDDSGLTILLEP